MNQCRISNVKRLRGECVPMKTKLLIVDDQAGIRLLLTDIFINEGYDVTTAQTGKEALDKIIEHPFDLVLLDYNLPVLNGLQVIKQMEKREITVPVVLMSGLIDNVKEELGCSRTTIQTVDKPFNIKDIRELVKGTVT